MGIFTILGRIFGGKKAGVEKKLVQTESYWAGLEAEIDSKVEEVQAKHRKALAVVNVKLERRQKLQVSFDESKATAVESRERFKETNDEKWKTNAMNAFNQMEHYKVAIEVLDSEIEQLRTLEAELKVLVDNAVHIAKNKRAEIVKAKSRVQFSDTMKGLTDGIKEFTTMELEGSEEVDITYHENMENLKSLTAGVVKPVSKDTDFDAFFNEGTVA